MELFFVFECGLGEGDLVEDLIGLFLFELILFCCLLVCERGGDNGLSLLVLWSFMCFLSEFGCV